MNFLGSMLRLLGIGLSCFAFSAAAHPIAQQAGSAPTTVPVSVVTPATANLTTDHYPKNARAPEAPANHVQPTPTAEPATTLPVTDAAAVDPVVESIRSAFTEKSLVSKANHADDVAALAAFYGARTETLWIKNGAYSDEAKAVIAELKKADDWGLELSDFGLSDLASGASKDAQAVAEVELALASLRYARYARGGRLDPRALSNILDMKPPVLEPGVVLRDLAQAGEPDAYLRGLNPTHAGFERLRQALLSIRGANTKDQAIDPALLVKLPVGKLLKPGSQDDQVALLRKRLKVIAEKPEDERRYDDALVAAVRNFQTASGIKPTGNLNNRTRSALNEAGHRTRDHSKRDIDRLLANMERWRWLPPDLGAFYVMNNIPEFMSETWKGDELKLRQKMIVGQPSWPTPVLAASMQFVIFHPAWGMPDGIKSKELLPRLKNASGGSNFFDQLFGVGSGGAQVLRDYKLQVTMNGRPVDPDLIDWNNVDIRKFDFIQPPGAENPLGQVKFRFPNNHNVYMHDTPQRKLFGKAFRALSHGCMRLEEPRKTAEVILAEDKGWPVDKVDELYKGGNSITLDNPIPVYLVYFTARVDDGGQLHTFDDIYGNDSRVMQALRGHPVRYTAPQAMDPSEASDQLNLEQRPKRKS